MSQPAKITPWPDTIQPTKEVILDRFLAEGLSPYEWSNEPGYIYPDHDHPYHKMIYVVLGSIRFTLPSTGEALDMAPGDHLDLMAGTVHEAVVGPQGVVCLEAHREP